jgi:hypothetical protein
MLYFPRASIKSIDWFAGTLELRKDAIRKVPTRPSDFTPAQPSDFTAMYSPAVVGLGLIK